MDGLAAEESTILPLVLEHVWKQNVVLFASNLEHVQRGALFCLYPNHLQLGRRLAELTEKHDASGLAPLRDVRIAVNLHTASHLGLDLSDERSTFDLVLPAN
jgi:putative ABC transport system substrate-binding protein